MSAAHDGAPRYRVVGIRQNGIREVRAEYLYRATAEAVQMGAIASGEYRRVVIERQPKARSRKGRRVAPNIHIFEVEKMDDPQRLYQVVAIRNDGIRVELAIDLRIDRAQAIVDALKGIAAFQSVTVEPQADEKPRQRRRA